MIDQEVYIPQLSAIQNAQQLLKSVIYSTPTARNINYSEKYEADIFFKREDLQVVRSYKIRGAYNKIASLNTEVSLQGVVCASAGNHAQGVAYACRLLGVKAHIFMPITTPKQKVNQVKMFGRSMVDIRLIGDTFDDCLQEAKMHCQEQNSIFIHPFDDPKVIEGQATVAMEILQNCQKPIDYLIFPVGGGGLAAGVSTVFKQLSPNTQLIAVEPEGAPSMQAALAACHPVRLDKIDKFIDGAAVQQVGDYTFGICQQFIDRILTVPEGLVCKTILDLYNEEAIVVEPAGALSVAALNLLQKEIKGKQVVCIISGGNNDISRTEEIQERALLYEQLKHYFTVKFPQRAGALREFVVDVLGEQDDIVYFQYIKKNNKAKGLALVGIELKNAQDLTPLVNRMKAKQFYEQHLNERPDLLHFLVE